MKRDYLEDGTMADGADLVVLGGYYGTGKNGGLISVFLMGVYNDSDDAWYTVTKVGNGFDDATLLKLQEEFGDAEEIGKCFEKCPPWLNVSKRLVPDVVVRDPKNSQVWEVTGAEFLTGSDHTANGISIRFPRVTRIRHDKNWSDATNLGELESMVNNMKG